MKNITEEKISKNIEKIPQKVKIPKDISNKILKNVFINLLIAIVLMAYLIGINIAYSKLEQPIIERVIQVSTLIFLGISLVLMEISYKKESGKYLINSIEMLVVASHSLSIMHVTKVFKFDFQLYMLVSSYIFSIYYVLKTIIIHTKGKKDYLKSLSDISEIVKKDEPAKKEATKKNTQEVQEEIKKVDIEKNKKKAKTNTAKSKEVKLKNEIDTKKQKANTAKIKEDKKEQVKEQTNIETENKPKKRGRPRKVTTLEDNKTSKTKNNDSKTNKAPTKKKESTQKSKTTKTVAKTKGKEEENKKEENVQLENKPKKRGRPKKEEVKLND